MADHSTYTPLKFTVPDERAEPIQIPDEWWTGGDIDIELPSFTILYRIDENGETHLVSIE